MAKRQDIVYGDVFAGETIVLRFRVIDSSRNAVDITGWTAKAVLAASEGGSAVHSVAGSITDAIGGLWTATLSRGSILALQGDDLWYGGWRSDTNNERLLAYGTFRVSPAPQLP